MLDATNTTVFGFLGLVYAIYGDNWLTRVTGAAFIFLAAANGSKVFG